MITHNNHVVFWYGVPISWVHPDYNIIELDIYTTTINLRKYSLKFQHKTSGWIDIIINSLDEEINSKIAFKAPDYINDYA